MHVPTYARYIKDNPLDEIIQDEEFDRKFDAHYDGGRDDDGVGGLCGDDVDVGPIDGDSSDDEFGDGDFLSQLVCHTTAAVLVASCRGLANFQMVRKSGEENISQRTKGCPKCWTELHFILELLTLKAKHSW